MHEAKTQLSKLVSRALAGEEVILTHGRDRSPVVKLVPIAPSKRKGRPIGLYKGQIDLGPDFFAPLPDPELAAWESSPSDSGLFESR